MSLAARLQPLLRPGATVASYAAYGSEIDPRAIEAMVDRLAFPRVTPGGMTFHAARFDELEAGYSGIAEPIATAPRAIPDIVLVPLIAVDRQGNRLGHGQGHYDRALATSRSAGRVLVIGLAWDVQIVCAVPTDIWDQPLDALVTPERLLRFGA